jgi:hypothetical protein
LIFSKTSNSLEFPLKIIKNNELTLIDANQIQEFSPVLFEDLKALEYVNDDNEIDYYNIELEDIDGIFAEGIAIETIEYKIY